MAVLLWTCWLIEVLRITLFKDVLEVLLIYFLMVAKMLRTAARAEHPFILVLLAAIEAVGMDPSQIDQEYVELLFHCRKESLCFCRFFWILVG